MKNRFEDRQGYFSSVSILRHIDAEGSDRSAAIIASGAAEDYLRVCLDLFFSGMSEANVRTASKEKQLNRELYEGYGPLSSFSAKILFLYALGVISEEGKSELQIIKNIRNIFAHDVSDARFSREDIGRQCDNLCSWELMLSNEYIKIRHKDKEITRRDKFVYSSIGMMTKVSIHTLEKISAIKKKDHIDNASS